MTLLQFDHVSKRYPDGKEALQDVSFSLGNGELAFLTGHSGAGKSTLLKLIAVMERSHRGQILLDGQNLNKVKPRHIPGIRRKLGLIFQDYKLLNNRTVFDNVALPLVVQSFSREQIARKVRASLDKVGLLGKEQKYPLSLSGGEQQRVGIARAIINKPPLILADEPTGNLDPKLSLEIMNLFVEFEQVGVTVLIASHDIDLITGMNRRVLQLDQGRLLDS